MFFLPLPSDLLSYLVGASVLEADSFDTSNWLGFGNKLSLIRGVGAEILQWSYDDQWHIISWLSQDSEAGHRGRGKRDIICHSLLEAENHRIADNLTEEVKQKQL